jgi:TolB-like protein
VIRFDSYEFDVRARELRRGSERVRLQAQTCELLAMLLEQPGEVVTRAALAKRLWPEGTFVDVEHSLNAAVKRLRAALGDDTSRPRFVETQPRRGYRFIAPCTRSESGAGAGGRARVAVLPFTNGGLEPHPHAFGDGLTDDAIVHLGQYPNVELAAPTSSATFKSGSCLARDVGTALGADYLLEGSVRCVGDRARIVAWLVDTSSETPVWTGLYDRGLGDVLAVQADVAGRIARSLASAIAERPRRATPINSRARALRVVQGAPTLARDHRKVAAVPSAKAGRSSDYESFGRVAQRGCARSASDGHASAG